MSRAPDRLYTLLPAVYRLRDAEQGYPLRALLRVIDEQAEVVEDDIAQLYENWFVETCQDWVVPYIGELVGYRSAQGPEKPAAESTERDRQRGALLTPRRDVANSIRYRRRKGTLALLEQMAGDVAHWPARAVEMYRLLGWLQHSNHLRPQQGRTVDLRSGKVLDLLDGPFDSVAHTVDVRRAASHRRAGQANIPGIGVFVWRLKSYPVTHTPAYCLEDVGPQCFTFSVMGNELPLYIKPTAEDEPTHIAEELNVPAPIRRRALEERVPGQARGRASADYYGEGKSITIWAPDWPRKGEGQPIPREQLIPADLSDWRYRAPRGFVAVDPVLGRMVFPANQRPNAGVWVSYHYAFSADMGGGEYERPLTQPSADRLLPGHIKQLAALAKKLRDPQDAPSEFIRTQLGETTRTMLQAYDPAASDSPPAALEPALLADLNRVMRGESIYEMKRFEQVPLPAAILALIGSPVQGETLRHLNRMLLAAAFPAEIAQSYAFYPVSAQDDLKAVIDRWRSEQPASAVIEFTQSGVYTQQLNLELRDNQSLQIRAANGARPVIRLLDYMAERPDAFSVLGGVGSRLTLDGILVAGRGLRIYGQERDAESGRSGPDICDVVIRHCTFVPGWALGHDCEPRRPNEASIVLENTTAALTIDHSIIGTILVTADQVTADPNRIVIADSIVDATDADLVAIGALTHPIAFANLSITRTTVIGQVQTHTIDLAENSIFYGLVRVAHRQRGCMRFCWAPTGSRTPRRFMCQPETAEAAAENELRDRPVPTGQTAPAPADFDLARQRARNRVRPQFNSLRYGRPTYCQLAPPCAEEITRGADDEAELGVFHDLYQPQRLANLQARLDEYAPAGMDVGVFLRS